MARDNFTKEKTNIIAQRAAYLCSNPECRMITSGPHSDKNKSLKNGVAAHICAASVGGPRYDSAQSSEERASISNGIWLCHNCSDLVDKDLNKYTKEVLIDWLKIHGDYIEKERMVNYSSSRDGGKGGEIFTFTNQLSGNGLITVDGGDGRKGGDAGKIHNFANKNDFSGIMSAKGGNGIGNPVSLNKDVFFEDIYSHATGAQLRFIKILRESMRLGGRGMDCGYVRRYFIDVIGSKTDRYQGWITPFITAYLQEKELVSVRDNFFSLNKIGEEFLTYIEGKKYPIEEREL